MRKGGGKSKGSAFERDICKRLSLWITDGKREDVFWRSAISGGRATVAHKKSMQMSNAAGYALRSSPVRQCGDICAVSPEGHVLTDEFFIECKHVRKLALDQFLIKGTGPLATFWEKACKEAKKYRRKPMIIARQNGWPVLVVTKPFDFVMPVIQAKIIKAKHAHINLFEEWMESSLEKWMAINGISSKIG